MTILEIVVLYLIVIFSFLLTFNFKWIIKTLREISHPENQGGYTKLIQIGIIFVLFAIFIAVMFYFFFNPEKVDGMNIILTVVVGWISAIIGQFFGEKTMENLDIKRKEGVMEANKIIESYEKLTEDYNKVVQNLTKKLKKK